MEVSIPFAGAASSLIRGSTSSTGIIEILSSLQEHVHSLHGCLVKSGWAGLNGFH